MVRTIAAKTILSSLKEGADTFFGLRYNMNLYRGCQHGCIYCDSRSKCYQLGELSDIRIKENALTLLENELRSKRVKGTIGFGSMNDPYMPIEKVQELTRQALGIINKYHFPVHIITKSNLVVRDVDLLKETGKTYAAVSITITTADDSLSKQIEPGAPDTSQRFEAIRLLSDAGIYCGITLMPVLPFITDSTENIQRIVELAKQNGASYILAAMGMTLREGQREYYYHELDNRFPELKEKYRVTYGERYNADAPNQDKLWNVFYHCCKENGIATKMKFYQHSEVKQYKLF
jgi:DNA repair photolyase